MRPRLTPDISCESQSACSPDMQSDSHTPVCSMKAESNVLFKLVGVSYCIFYAYHLLCASFAYLLF